MEEKIKKIIHIDMDYFFAQVEERDNSTLRDKPVGIGGISENGRGVLCTSNYIARKFGVKSAMPTAKALKLCPDLVLINPNFQKYKEVYFELLSIYKIYTPIIEAISLDEVYLDVTYCELFNNDAIAIAKDIKRKILEKTKLTASAGVSFNKFLAKIGSDLNKPNGLSVLRPQNIDQKIKHFSISKIWGAGKVTQKKMNEFNIYTFGDLQKYSKLDLINMFGDFGATLFNYCRGVDDRVVRVNSERKSLSVEHTFSEDTICKTKIDLELESCFEEMLIRLQKYKNKKDKSILLKIKYFDFENCTIESQTKISIQNYKSLFQKKIGNESRKIRLIGVGVKFYYTKNIEQLEFQI